MKTKFPVWEKYIAWSKTFWPLLIPVWIFLSGITGFPYSSNDALYSDLVISHYPNAIFLQRSLIYDHVVPLWSPTILSGYPFAANPLAGLWYPPGWFALLFPLPLGFNITVILHILWGGLGMYNLLRRERLSHMAALFGALAFESLPKIIAHYGAGHLTLVYALVWTPWLLLATYPQTNGSRWRKVLSPGFLLAVIFLADPRWAVYAGLLWIAYYFAGWRKKELRFRSLISIFLSQSLIAALLAAPLAIPLLEYTRLSTRISLTANDVLADSLPPIRLLGLLFPDFSGHHEWMLYPGGVVLILTVVTLLTIGYRSRSTFWIAVFLVTVLFALGEYVPGMEALAQLPGFNLLRVPPRALFLSGIALTVSAACGLDVLLEDWMDLPQKRIKLTLMGLVTFALVLTLSIGVITGQWERNYLWGVAMIVAASLGVWLQMGRRISSTVVFVLFLAISLIDWGQINSSVLTFRDNQIVLAENEQVTTYLSMQKGNFRNYSPSYSLPQQTAVMYGLSLVDGVDPLQLSSYSEFMEEATGVNSQGYSVTLPPFANADPQHDNAIYSPNATMMGLLNVRFLIADFDLPVDGLVLRERFGTTRIYENLEVGPRAWVQMNNHTVAKTTLIDWKPNRIIMTADGPGILVLSEIAYPGWRVYVDGEKVSIEKYNDILRAVKLLPGNHEVKFLFYPLSVYIGLVGFVLGVILVFFSSKRDCY